MVGSVRRHLRHALTVGAVGALGNSQSLDHRVSYDVVHVNAEFSSRASDHDPQVARISLR